MRITCEVMTRLRLSVAWMCFIIAAPAALAHVPVFGPKTFTIDSGRSETLTESFTAEACDAHPLAVWTLVVQNGAADGSQRVSSASIVLNGEPIVVESDFNQVQAEIGRSVQLKASNTLAVTLKGGAKDGRVVVTLRRHIALTESAVAAIRFTTTSAREETFPRTFSIPSSEDVFTLILRNGDGTAATEVQGAAVALNGTEIVAKNDLKQAGGIVRKTVRLAAVNDLSVTLDAAGAGAFVTLEIVRDVVDTAGPAIVFSNVVDGQIVATTPFAILAAVSDPSGIASVSAAGQPVSVGADGSISAAVALVPGPNRIGFVLTDCEGNVVGRDLTLVYNAAPTITITAPQNGFMTRNATVTVTGTATDAVGLASVTVNGQLATLDGTNWSAVITLNEGAHDLVATATNGAGKQTTAAVRGVVDLTPPVLALDYDIRAQNWNDAVFLLGSVEDALTATTVACNGVTAAAAEGRFHCTIPLTPGVNAVSVEARDGAGNATLLQRSVTYTPDAVPPSIAATIEPPPDANGWIRGHTIVTFTCSDALSGVAICSSPRIVATDGEQNAVGRAVDEAGNETKKTVTVRIDGTYPTILLDPVAPVIRASPLLISGTVIDAESGVAATTCGGLPATMTGDRFTCSVAIPVGTSQTTIVATDRAGNSTEEHVVVQLDVAVPVIALAQPAADRTVNTDTIVVEGVVTDDDSVSSLTLNGLAAPVIGRAFSISVPLADGANALTLRATDRGGNETTIVMTVTRVSVPEVAIQSPVDLAIVSTATVAVRGTVRGAVTVDVNGIAATISGGTFTAANVPLQQGRAVLTATARNTAGRVATSTLHVYRDSLPPRLEIVWPEENGVVGQASLTVAGTVEDLVVGTINSEHMTVTVNGAAAVVSNRTFAAPVTLQPGANSLTIAARDQAGNTTTKTVVVTFTSDQPRLVTVSGGGQSTVVGTRLPQKLVARLLNAAGQPVTGTKVMFRVVQNDGHLAGTDTSGRSVIETTNAAGEASVAWTLGNRAGSGNQRVEASAEGALPIEFLATGNVGAPALIVVDSGNAQFGAVSAPAPRPLVAIVVDSGFNRLRAVPVRFRVTDGGGSFDGLTEVTVFTDSDGRAVVRPTLGSDPGEDNNAFVATVSGVSSSAGFTASGRVAGDPARTSVSGVVLDNSDIPIAGVSVRIEGTPLVTQTNAQGQFRLTGVPVGYVRLFVDGSSAQRSGTWPMLEFTMTTIAGVDNTVGMPVYLLPIDVARGLHVDDVTGGTLTVPELPGFSLSVAPGTATFPGGGRTGTVSATLVHLDKVPMAPAFGQQPRFIVTIQPAGTHFEPPAPVTFPNLDGLAPGTVTELYSFDHDLGQFVSIGTGSVSEDGSTIRSNPGSGISKGGWHGGGPPNPTGTTGSLQVTLRGEFHDFDPATAGSTAAAPQPKLTADARHTRVQVLAESTAEIHDVAVGAQYDFVANGGGAENSRYVWTAIENPAIANIVNAPPCEGQSSCRATVVGNQPGLFAMQVTFLNATTSSHVTEVHRVRFVKLKLKIREIHFRRFDGQPLPVLYRDRRANLTASPPVTAGATLIAVPQWIAPNATLPNGKNEPLLYVRKEKMRLTVVAEIESIEPPGPVKGLVLIGDSAGVGKVIQRNVTLPESGTAFLTQVDLQDPIPDTTRFYDPLTFTWQFLLGSAVPQDLGQTTQHKVYVSLAQPINTRNFLTSVHLALSAGEESSEQGALQRTWEKFASTSVKSWDGTPFYYYKKGFGDEATAICPSNTDEFAILTAAEQSSQCTGFAALLKGALGVNGVRSDRIYVEAHLPSNDPATFGPQVFMLVKSWQVKSPPAYSIANPNLRGWNWRYATEDRQLTLWRPEGSTGPVAPTPGTAYGNFINAAGIAGQNMSTPTEKLFGNHVIVKPLVRAADGTPITLGAPFYDPSYGSTYTSAVGFETTALAGYVRQTPIFANDPHGLLAYALSGPAPVPEQKPSVIFCMYDQPAGGAPGATPPCQPTP